MNLTLASTGSYPRIGDSPELQVLRRTIAAVDRGERTHADLAAAEDEMTRRAIAEQAQAGIELLTDGLIRWYDPISHLAGKLSGVQIRGLLRFFDTNFYFRQPALTRRPQRKEPLLVSEFAFAVKELNKLRAAGAKAAQPELKPVLTGPYTLAKFSLGEDSSLQALEARAEAYAEALAAEISALAEAGAKFIQMDEPAVIKYPRDWACFARALEPVWKSRQHITARGKPLQLALYVYFHDPAPLYEKLTSLPADVLGLDFTYNPKLVDVVAGAGSPVPLGLGLVDGRNTKLENPAAVARQIDRMLPKIAPKHPGTRAYLGASSGLEYLPRDRAYAKLGLLKKIRDAMQG